MVVMVIGCSSFLTTLCSIKFGRCPCFIPQSEVLTVQTTSGIGSAWSEPLVAEGGCIIIGRGG